MEEPGEAPEIPHDTLMQWIRELPEGYRTVFNLFVFEEYGHKEIADMLGISESTSKTQLLKARRWLAVKVRDYETNKRFAIR